MAVAARNIRRINLSQMAVAKGYQDWEVSPEESACAIVEGINLGLYKFKKHYSGEQKSYKTIEELIISSRNEARYDEIVRGTEKGKVLSEATNLARDLVNEPANFLTPDIFAKEAIRVANENNIKITVLGKEEIRVDSG